MGFAIANFSLFLSLPYVYRIISCAIAVAQMLKNHLEHRRYLLERRACRTSVLLQPQPHQAKAAAQAVPHKATSVCPPQLEKGNVTLVLLCLLGFQEEYGSPASDGLFFGIPACDVL